MRESIKPAVSLEASGEDLFNQETHIWPPPSIPPLGKQAHNAPDARLRVAVNGRHAELRPERRAAPSTRKGGGARGPIEGFSRDSKRRLKRMLAGVDRGETAVFVTLTFPGSGPRDPDVCHALMRKWDKRIVRNFEKFGLIWRRAWQVRGTPHYHLIAWPPKSVEVAQFLDCMRREWIDVAGDGSGWFRDHGFHGEPVECFERVGGYLCRREKVLGRGRPWSTFRHGLIPIRYEHTKLDRSQYLKIRRVFGHLSRPLGGRDRRPKRVRSLEQVQHVYASHMEISKLLRFLGVSTT